MTNQPTPEATEAVALILSEGGADALHGWRCDYPDRYGPCTCLAELAEDTLKDLRDAIHGDRADAGDIRDALGLRLEERGCSHGGVHLIESSAGWSTAKSGTPCPNANTYRLVGEWREVE